MTTRILKSGNLTGAKEERKRVRCPECKSHRVFGRYHIEHSGFLLIEGVKVGTYTCSNCACIFEKRTKL